MDRTSFEAELTRDGFKVQKSTLAAGRNNSEHTHPFDARLYVLKGNIKIGCEENVTNYGPSDACSMNADTLHTEVVKSEDVAFWWAGATNSRVTCVVCPSGIMKRDCRWRSFQSPPTLRQFR